MRKTVIVSVAILVGIVLIPVGIMKSGLDENEAKSRHELWIKAAENKGVDVRRLTYEDFIKWMSEELKNNSTQSTRHAQSSLDALMMATNAFHENLAIISMAMDDVRDDRLLGQIITTLGVIIILSNLIYMMSNKIKKGLKHIRYKMKPNSGVHVQCCTCNEQTDNPEMEYQVPAMINKAFFLAGYLVSIFAAVMLIAAGISWLFLDQELGISLIFAGIFLSLLSEAIKWILLYKLWAAIQGPFARTSPVCAVGFMLIPFFNLYWIFVAYYGWAKDYNNMVSRRNYDGPKMSEKTALYFSLSAILGWLPLVGYINIIYSMRFISSTCNCVNALAKAKD